MIWKLLLLLLFFVSFGIVASCWWLLLWWCGRASGGVQSLDFGGSRAVVASFFSFSFFQVVSSGGVLVFGGRWLFIFSKV